MQQDSGHFTYTAFRKPQLKEIKIRSYYLLSFYVNDEYIYRWQSPYYHNINSAALRTSTSLSCRENGPKYHKGCFTLPYNSSRWRRAIFKIMHFVLCVYGVYAEYSFTMFTNIRGSDYRVHWGSDACLHKVIPGHWHRGRWRRNRHSGILYLSPVPEHS